MKIDVVIPTYYPDEKLVRTLHTLSEQETGIEEAVLLDTLEPDGKSPLESLLLKKGIGTSIGKMKLTVVRIPRQEFDHGGTRDLGASYCRDADRILFMTQDAVPVGTDLTKELAAGFDKSSNAAACYARQLPAADARLEEQISRKVNYPEISRVKTAADYPVLGIKTSFCSNVCAMYDGAVYRKLGGFIHHAVFNEDMIFADGAIRAGYSIVYCAEAKVIHSHNYNARQQFRRNFDLGVSQAEHPEVFDKVSSESEGASYVKKVVKGLAAGHAAGEIPGFVIRCAFRLMGYKAGKNYKKMPKAWIRRWTMSPAYWDKGETDGT